MMLLPAITIMLVQDGDLTLRRGEVPPLGKIAIVSTEGVAIEDDTGTQITIGWQRVMQIEGEFAQQWEAYRPIADRAWRAGARLERGDVAAAEPLLEDLAREFAGRQGPTAEMVWTGLLRARLQRGAHLAAVDPWLELISGAPSFGGPNDNAGEPIIDGRTGLVPALPPIWVDWPAVQAFAAKELDAAALETDADRLALLYREAARIETGWDMEAVETNLKAMRDAPKTINSAYAPGVDLVEQMVLARVGTADERSAAREKLSQMLDSSPVAWEHAWIRCAIGRSLVHESDENQRRRGVVQLLYVPATLSEVHPYLAGLAIAESVIVLDALGDRAGADQLYAELLERYADHPVMDWPDIRERRPSG